MLPVITCSPKEALKKWRIVEKGSIQAERGRTHTQLVSSAYSSVPVPLRTDHESQMSQALRTEGRLPGLVQEDDGGDGNLFSFLQYFFKMMEIEFAQGL